MNYQGRWAVVAGASTGTGAAFARGLARRKLNLVLIARSQDKLEAIAKDLRARFKVEVRTTSQLPFTHHSVVLQVRVIIADLAQRPFPYHDIKPIIDGLKVAILINSAGGTRPYRPFRRFHEYSIEEQVPPHLVTGLDSIRCDSAA